MTNIVPFGKYRGQPVEAMAADHQYMEWLTAQPWFREKHQNIYTLIVNNFHEPSETPEHNKLQARFLDRDFVLALIGYVWGGNGDKAPSIDIKFEFSGFDVMVLDSYFRMTLIEIKPTLADEYPAVLRQMKAAMRSRGFHREFDGTLVYHSSSMLYYVKPVLYIGDYTGVGATFEDVKCIFAADGIVILKSLPAES